MKLKNKLLPLIGTAAITATALPLALTSCGTTYTEDLTKGYTPTITPLELEGDEFLNQNLANKTYFEKVNENPKIFHEDLMNAMYSNYSSWNGEWSSYQYKLRKLNVTHSNPTFNYVNIIYPGEGSFPYPTISMTMSFDLEYDETYAEDQVIVQRTVSKSISADYNNLIFYAQYTNQDDGESWMSTGLNSWKFGIGDPMKSNWIYQYFTSDYSLKYTYSETIDEITTNIRSGTRTEETKSNNDSNDINSYSKVKSFTQNHAFDDIAFGFQSNYMQLVKPLPEICAYNLRGTSSTGSGATTTNKVDVSGFYLSGDASKNYEKVKAVLDEDLVLDQINVAEGDTATTLTIPKDAFDIGDVEKGTSSISLDLEGLELGAAKEVTQADASKTFYFRMPKSFKVTFTYEGTVYEESTWTQTVYTNINTLAVTITYQA